MHKVWIVGCTTIALVTLSLAAAAQQGDEETKRMGIKGKVITKNAYGNAYLWITIYDTGKSRQLDHGCVDPNTEREWTNGQYGLGDSVGRLGNVHVRGELMTQPGCKGTKLCDTTMEVRPPNEVVYHQNKSDPRKCYLDYPRLRDSWHPPSYLVGSYLDSCTNIKLADNGTLTANCRRSNGSVVPASLKPGCRSAVSNQDGRLACGP